ncbi:MAG TPA: carboxymuconolactone decarboxylase family protein, partial [Gemmatimonadaceae bacterium]
MTPPTPVPDTLSFADDETLALVRLAAVLTAGTDEQIRAAIVDAASIRALWVEELLLQLYLFAGFPRALNASREWRRIHPQAVAPADDRTIQEWRIDGERTCEKVYGTMYDRLRSNIRDLHPLLDDWMITEGYGKVLSRPGLDLGRRELCIVAACAAANQDRQLHSHLRGALNVGVASSAVDASLAAIAD